MRTIGNRLVLIEECDPSDASRLFSIACARFSMRGIIACNPATGAIIWTMVWVRRTKSDGISTVSIARRHEKKSGDSSRIAFSCGLHFIDAAEMESPIAPPL